MSNVSKGKLKTISSSATPFIITKSDVDIQMPTNQPTVISHLRQCSILSETTVCPSFHGLPSATINTNNSEQAFILKGSDPNTTNALKAHQRKSSSIQLSTDNNDGFDSSSISTRLPHMEATRHLNRMHDVCVSCTFELHGFLRGVGFSKHTARQARELKLGGWCRHLPNGCVCGELEGPGDRVTAMQNWLQLQRSRKAHATSTEFSQTRTVLLGKRRFDGFAVRRKGLARIDEN